jgi:lipopolysaccharide export system permease protein
MIFQRALQRELISTAGAVFTTLFTITITFMLVKILGRAAGGRVASSDVMALIGFTSLNYLPTLLILTGFISVLMVVSRSYQDSEMVVWFASGLSLSGWIKPVLQFALPLVVVIALLSFFAAPWANKQNGQFQQRFEKREDIAKVSPGKFQESASSNRIFFVEGISGDVTKVQNVFVNTVKDGRVSTIVAREGTIDVKPNGEKFLIMRKGRRYEGVPDQADFQLMEFDRYSVRVPGQSKELIDDTSAKSSSTKALLLVPNNFNMAEFLWRISLPITGLLLPLLAIPLGFVNPRAGRSANLIIALLLYVTYTNLLNVMQAQVAQQRFSFGLAWWPVHGMAAIAVLMLFLWRLNVNSRYHPLVIWARWKRKRFA